MVSPNVTGLKIVQAFSCRLLNSGRCPLVGKLYAESADVVYEG